MLSFVYERVIFDGVNPNVVLEIRINGKLTSLIISPYVNPTKIILKNN